MKQLSVSDSFYHRAEKMAEILGTTPQKLVASLVEDAVCSLEAQIAEMKKREARAAANPERVKKALSKVFAAIKDSDRVDIDQNKLQAIDEQSEKDHKYNMDVYKQRHRGLAAKVA